MTESTEPAPGNRELPSASWLLEMLPQYDIVDVLGKGGMGAVFKGRQAKLDRDVAIKLLYHNKLEGDEELKYLERFHQEAKALAKLSHSNIVSVFDFGETRDGQLYLVMEYIDGMDIQDYLNQHGGSLSQEHALSITADVLDALAYAHSHGIIHRDIKPANILLDQEGRVKIADFGLAKKLGDFSAGLTTALTSSNVAVGTPDFMAPEMLQQGREVDHRADIYAVGVMLYQLLTGLIPRGIFKMPSILNSKLDARLDRIIGKAMETDPDLRYLTAADVRVDLDKIINESIPKLEVESKEKIGQKKNPRSSDKYNQESTNLFLWQYRIPLMAGAVLILLAVLGIMMLGDRGEDGVTAVNNDNESGKPLPSGMKKGKDSVTSSATKEKAVVGSPWKTGKLRIFIIAGQSNTASMGSLDHLDKLIQDPEVGEQYSHLKSGGDWSERDNVFVKHYGTKGLLKAGYGYRGDHRYFGPELQMGHVLGDRIEDPVLIIKFDDEVSKLGVKFRTTGAVDVIGANSKKYKEEYEKAYATLLEEIRYTVNNLEVLFPDQSFNDYSFEGVLWVHNWDNMASGDYKEEYGKNLFHFIADIRRDLNNPLLSFVIAELGRYGDKPVQSRPELMKKAQEEIVEVVVFGGNITFLKTAFFIDATESENADIFFEIGKASGEQMLRLLELNWGK